MRLCQKQHCDLVIIGDSNSAGCSGDVEIMWLRCQCNYCNNGPWPLPSFACAAISTYRICNTVVLQY